MQFSVEWARQLEELGLSVDFGAMFFTLGSVIPGMAMIITGGLVFWRRSDDWLALLVSLWLVTWGAEISSQSGTAPLLIAQPAWSGPIIFLSALTEAFFPLVLYLFPNGRLVPRWAWWSLLPLTLALGLFGALAPKEVADPLQPILLPIFSALFLTVVGAQVYRYLQVSTPTERQQTKWLIAGLPLFAVIQIVWFLVIMPWLDQPGATVLGLLVSFPVVSTSLLLIPIPIAIGILRYRLWDVDIVINRGLVYGGLTVLLGAIFVGGFFGLRTALESVLPGVESGVAAGVSGAVTVGLFAPARRWMRIFVDRRIYHINVDYQKADTPTPSPIAVSGILRTQLGAYENLEPIGRGGMAEIYKARHPTLDKTVAIKVLPHALAKQPDFRKRFEREAKVVSSLKHPNIVQVFDFGEAEGTYYMVMEYVGGRDLGDVIHDAAPLPIERVHSILEDIAGALDYAHGQGLVHRDVKPSNVMLESVTSTGQRDKTERAVLMDFGIARILTGNTRLTATGTIGTFDYIAPEQIQAASNVDGRADVYSLGVMAYQVLTGHLPFDAGHPAALLIAHLNQPCPDPRERVHDLPDRAASAILQAMAKKPDQRFNTAGEFVTALTG